MMSTHLLVTVIDVGRVVFEFLINCFLQSTLLIGVGLLIGSMLRKRGAALQSVIYRVTLASAVLCPLATVLLAVGGASGWSLHLPADGRERPVIADAAIVEHSGAEQRVFAEPLPMSVVDEIPFPSSASPTMTTADETPAAAAVSREVQDRSTDMLSTRNNPIPAAKQPSIPVVGLLTMVCAAIWFVCVLVFSIRLVSASIQIKQLRRNSGATDRQTRVLCDELAALMRIQAPEVRHNPLVTSPFLTGVIKPAIMLPEAETELQLREVLIHELAHLRRADCFWNFVINVSTAIFFYQPLFWVLGNRIQAMAEDVCDDYVVRLGGDRLQYASQLADIAEQSLVPPVCVGMISVRSTLTRRITRILDGSRTLSTRVGNLIALTVIVVGITVTMTAGLIGLSSRATSAETKTDKANADRTQKPDANKTAIGNNQQVQGQSAAVAAAERVYQGTVVDPKGKPVAGAKIFVPAHVTGPMGLLEATWKPVTVTNSAGEFRFGNDDLFAYESTNLDEWGYFHVCATADGYGFAWSNSTVLETSGLALKKLRERADTVSEVARAELLKLTESMGKPLQLIADDQPIHGQIMTVEGRPVKDAKVTLIEVDQGRDGTLDGWLEKTEEDRADYYSARMALESIHGPQVRSLIAPISSDANGKFVVRGLGRDRIATLLIEGPGIQSEMIYARTRPGKLIEIPNQFGRGARIERYESNELTHVAGPSQPIVGVVKDKITKQPIPGALILSQKRHGHPIHGWGQDFVRTLADAEGRFKLDGMPIGNDNIVGVIPPAGAAYISTSSKLKTTADPQPLKLDFELQPGVWITGRVTDKQTGEGLAGHFERFTSRDNPASDRNSVDERQSLVSDAHGRYRIVVAPGQGILAFSANRHEPYPRGVGAQAITNVKKASIGIPAFDTNPSYCISSNHHFLTETNYPLEQKEVELNFALDTSSNIAGQVVDQSGNPLPAALMAGHLKEVGSWHHLDAEGRFSVIGYDPAVPRKLTFVDHEHNLAGHVTLSGPVAKPLIVKLESAGIAKGRIVDELGDPIPNLTLHDWRPYSADPAMKMRQTIEDAFPLPPDNSKAAYRTTNDADGRFTLRGLIPGREYRVSAASHRKDGIGMSLGPLDVVIKVNAGETLDVGDVKITSEKAFSEKYMLSTKVEN